MRSADPIRTSGFSGAYIQKFEKYIDHFLTWLWLRVAAYICSVDSDVGINLI